MLLVSGFSRTGSTLCATGATPRSGSVSCYAAMDWACGPTTGLGGRWHFLWRCYRSVAAGLRLVLGVELLDLVPPLLLHHLATHRELWRQLAAIDGEVVGDDQELL